ncbi:MAG: RagB/SusD family nutrient uptake outer membrane protein [Muribaculaceae bacterium]|nr:RagB/SusD family nutrient uptake outer membrane protein [Muribaculaceae bacterium]
MKKLMILAAVAASFALCSCDDFLTEDIRGRENLNTYFKTQEEVDAAVGGCYFQLCKYGWWQIEQVYLLEEMMTDNAWDGNTSQEDGYREVSHFYPTASSSGIIQNFWGARYQGISSCNVCIERIPGANMDERLRNIRVAEARFLRAYFYFELVNNFGGVPLVLEQIGSAEGVTRASLDECYNFIETEFAEVAEILPQRSEWSDADMGRATRGAALGFLGKTQLYHGKFPEAKKTLETLISEGEYDLMENFGDIWSVKHNNNKESLFEIQMMYGGENYATGSAISVVCGCRNGIGDGWAWGLPSADLENAYIAAGDSERLRWTIIKTGCTSIAGETQFSRFIDNNASCGNFGSVVWENGIKKFKGNEAYNGYCKSVEEGGFGWTDNTALGTYLIDPKIHKSARICRKYFIPLADRPEIYNIDKIPLNQRLLRYGDVYLMYAEACNECNDDGNARIYLNKIRTRAKLQGVPETMSGEELRQAIRTERRLELAFEQCRLYDIRRWKEADGKTVMEHLFGPNGTFVKYNTNEETADMYEWANQGESSDKGIRFQAPRDLLWPIPVYEIQHTNGSLAQNPG